MSQTTHCLTIEVVKADFTRVALITASPNRIFIHVIGDPTQARQSNGNAYPTILGRSCSYKIALRASSKIIPYNDIPSKYSRSDPNSDDATNSLTFVGGPDIFFWSKLLEQWSPRKQQSELQDFVLIYHQTFKATFISIQIDEQALSCWRPCGDAIFASVANRRTFRNIRQIGGLKLREMGKKRTHTRYKWETKIAEEMIWRWRITQMYSSRICVEKRGSQRGKNISWLARERKV